MNAHLFTLQKLGLQTQTWIDACIRDTNISFTDPNLYNVQSSKTTVTDSPQSRGHVTPGRGRGKPWLLSCDVGCDVETGVTGGYFQNGRNGKVLEGNTRTAFTEPLRTPVPTAGALSQTEETALPPRMHLRKTKKRTRWVFPSATKSRWALSAGLTPTG